MTKAAPLPPDKVTIVPANEASWDDIKAVFGTSDAGRRRCQRFQVVGYMWRDSTLPQRTEMLREQTNCGEPDAPTTQPSLRRRVLRIDFDEDEDEDEDESQ